jgi:hypothetical protein
LDVPAKEPEVLEHALDGYASSMAASGSLVAVGTTTAVYGIASSGPELLEIVGDEPNLPLETGLVRAMARHSEGLLIAAENGLFFTSGAVLQLSSGNDALHPLGIEAMSSRVADDDGDGTSETHLAILAGGKAHELTSSSAGGAVSGAELVAWTVEGEAGAPTAMLTQKDRVYLAFGARVYEINKATREAFPLVFDIGRVRAIGCGSLACDEGSLIYFASDQGLIERAPDGAYTRFSLAAEGEAPAAVETFALDAGKQRLYALAGSSVLRVRSGERPDAVATLAAPGLPRHVAVDSFGDVWVGEGSSLRKLALGTPLSFATDVRPVMHEYCAGCHAGGTNGAPKLDFESYDAVKGLVDVMLKRVSEGTMPPITYEKKLPKEKIQILEDWAVTKAP